MDNLLWWFGWRLKPTLILAIVSGVIFAFLIESIGGIILGLPFLILWFMGTRHINSNWEGIFNSAKNKAFQDGLRKLGINEADISEHLLFYGDGSAPLVKPNENYNFTPLYVGEKFLGIYEGPGLNLVNKKERAGTGTKELYFRHINLVDYKQPLFIVRSSSGDELQYQSNSQTAESALGAVRMRLREVVQ